MTPSHPSKEVRRQHREWNSYDRFHREERSAVPGAWFCVTALMIAAMLTSCLLSLPFHEVSGVASNTFLAGFEGCQVPC